MTLRAPHRFVSVFIGALLAVGGLSACSSDDSSGSGDSDTSSSGDYYPHTMDVLHGEVTIDEKPEKILALTAPAAEELLALGIEPYKVGEDPATLDSWWPWLADDISGVIDGGLLKDFWEPLPEAIAALEPDLIIAPTYAVADEAIYEQLSAIAPTVAPDSDALNPGWEERLLTTAEAVNETGAAEDLIEQSKEKYAEVGDGIPGLDDKTYQFVAFSGTEYAWGNGSMFELFGMKPAENQDDTMAADPLSQENTDQLDADLLAVLPRTPDAKTQLESDPLFQSLPAVQAGNVLYLDEATGNALNSPGPLALDWFLEQITPAIEKLG